MNQNRDFASWRVRGAAYLIDSLTPLAGMTLFWFGVLIAVGIGMGETGLEECPPRPPIEVGGGVTQECPERSDTPLWLFPLVLASAVVSVGYFVWWLIALKDGQTPGKKIVGIRAVRANTGETLGRGMMFVREFLVKSLLFSVFGSIMFIIVLGIAQFSSALLLFSYLPTLMVIAALQTVNFLWPLWDDNDQTLHYKIVRSHVVRN